jgi:hypothetical protein
MVGTWAEAEPGHAGEAALLAPASVAALEELVAARGPAHLLLARFLEERLIMVELVAARVIQEHVPAELLAEHAEVLLRHLCPSQTPPEKRRPAISRRRSCQSQ